jgi:hypothetical protein
LLFACDVWGVYFAEIQNILLADTGISWKTEGHSFSDQLISGSVSVMPLSVIEASVVLFCLFMTRVSQCPISLRAEHPK